MRLEEFSIEILVNGQPLDEYSLPIENSSSVTTGRSYVISNEYTKEKKYSNHTTYVAVHEPGSRFVVRYSSNRSSLWNPMMAYVYVDGEYDYTYREILSSSFREKDCFWNNSLDKKYYFKFAVTEMSDTSSLNQLTEQKSCGGLGAISIYFYKARIIPQKNVVIPPFSVNQAQVSESKTNVDIKMTTAFEEEGGYVNRQPISTMEKQSDDPIAVLHLHYRPVDWLRARGFDIPHESENVTKCKVIRECAIQPVII
ncbi:14112_t:CDS:2 [Acaulospora morrowiae]|uniref:14112_t:CDS:1 n=1 Tax=Acaulospora morrowiae TaxID=94023 RepID=A0A9N8W4N1_9GLOM|nr:14112_t:CDS:2 [Acaulospora morrowiae]